MKVVGITAEYNPFHRGHLHHLRRSLAAAGEESAAVVVLSGDFVQRGEAAVFSKFARAEAAVRCGASLVIELPLPWCLASAEGFARGAVGLMQAAGVIDSISFGCESGDAAVLEQTADVLLRPEMDELIRRELDGGVSYAAARERAAAKLAGEDAVALLRRPNDLLAIEYIKACRRLGAGFSLYALRRQGSQHDGAGSASELRAALRQSGDISGGVPAEAMEVFRRETEQGRGPVLSEDLEAPLLSRLRVLPREVFAALPDASEGIENRLYAASRFALSPEELAMSAKSRRYALSRLRRMTMCAALGITKEVSGGLPPYIRVLAMDEKGRQLLRRMREKATLPVIIKPAKARELDAAAQEIFRLGSQAHDLYVLGYKNKEFRRGGADWQTTPYIQ